MALLSPHHRTEKDIGGTSVWETHRDVEVGAAYVHVLGQHLENGRGFAEYARIGVVEEMVLSVYAWRFPTHDRRPESRCLEVCFEAN